MAGNNLMIPGVLVVLGAGIVVSMYMMLGGRAEPATKATRPEAQVMASGVRPAEVDRARSMDLDPKAGDEPSPRAPATLPQPRDAAPDDSAAAPAADAVPTSSVQDPKLHDQVVSELGRQLEGQKSALVRACAPGGGAGAAFSVGATFNAEGAMMAMAISDADKSSGTGAVGACLREQAIALSLDAPGQEVSVNVPLRLP